MGEKLYHLRKKPTIIGVCIFPAGRSEPFIGRTEAPTLIGRESDRERVTTNWSKQLTFEFKKISIITAGSIAMRHSVVLSIL